MMAFTGMMVLVTFAIGAVGVSGLEVQTASNVSLVSGKEATLPCRYNRSVFAVYWKYKPASSPLELLVALDNFYQVGERSGPGYEEGRFNITDDYSLIIHKVQADDDGEYICEVSDFITGRALRNNTVALVIVIAEHSFPRIHKCDATSDEKTEPCSLHVYQDQHTELTCSVHRVKPKVDLVWTSPELGGRVINASMKEGNLGDGVFDQTSTLVIDTSQHFDKRRFICTAEGLAVDGIVNQTITIYFTKTGPFTGALVGWTFLGVAVFMVIAGIIWWRRKKYLKTMKRTPDAEDSSGSKGAPILSEHGAFLESPQKGTSSEIMENASRKISTVTKKGYVQVSSNTPGSEESGCRKCQERNQRSKIEERLSEITDVINSDAYYKPLYFGVFGNKDAGRASFIKALSIAYIGERFSEDAEQGLDETTIHGESVWKSTRLLSDLIGIREIKDTQNAAAYPTYAKRLKKVLQPISNDEGDIMEGDVIHYPIFVYDIRKHVRNEQYEQSLSKFSKAVKSNISVYPILILTYMPPTENSKIINRLSTQSGIPIDDIFVYENNKSEDGNAEEDVNLRLLDMLLRCVKKVTGDIATGNIEYRLRSGKNAKKLWKKFRNVNDASNKLSKSQGKGESQKSERYDPGDERNSLSSTLMETST